MINGFSVWDFVCNTPASRTPWRRLNPPAAFVLLCMLPCASSASEVLSITEVMERVGRQVEVFWRDLPTVTCTEKLVQQKLDEHGKVDTERETVHDYTIAMRMEGSDLAIEESRLPRGKEAEGSEEPFLVSEGFATLVLILHPHFRSSFRFQLAAADGAQNQKLIRIQFEHRDGSPSPSVVQARSGDVPIGWQGSAWVDAETGNVVRIQVGLRRPPEVLGLQGLEGDVTYSVTTLEGSDHSYLLPQRAVIVAATVRQHWRNVHEFTAFRRFSVDTKLTLGVPE